MPNNSSDEIFKTEVILIKGCNPNTLRKFRIYKYGNLAD
jgi:hypothetical protein